MIAENILNECKLGNRQAQRQVYDYLVPKLYSTCKRYLNDGAQIEDTLAESCHIILTKINGLQEPAALVAWAKKITVNQCLQHIRKRVDFKISLDEIASEPAADALLASDKLHQKDLLQLLTLLPEGCRSIFNLFVIEGYSHKEIASQLAISEGTSKSQLNVAKHKLQELVNKYYYQNTNQNGIAK